MTKYIKCRINYVYNIYIYKYMCVIRIYSSNDPNKYNEIIHYIILFHYHSKISIIKRRVIILFIQTIQKLIIQSLNYYSRIAIRNKE